MLIAMALALCATGEQTGMATDDLQQNWQQADALTIDLNTQFKIKPALCRCIVDICIPIIDLHQVVVKVWLYFDAPAFLA